MNGTGAAAGTGTDAGPGAKNIELGTLTGRAAPAGYSIGYAPTAGSAFSRAEFPPNDDDDDEPIVAGREDEGLCNGGLQERDGKYVNSCEIS